MIFNASNNKFYIDDTYIDYLKFGKGKKTLVMIAGLSTMKIGGMALPMAVMYRSFLKKYTVYIIDRKSVMPEGYTVEQMADDTVEVMNSLGIKSADIVGVSQGGMIAQCIAVSRPDMVNKLVLAVTASRPNKVMEAVVGGWIDMVKNHSCGEFASDMMYRMYSDGYVSKYRMFMPLLTAIQKKTDVERFITQSEAILKFDIYSKLDKITCPVLIIGGGQDKVVTPQASEEIARKTGGELYIYSESGHALYDEEKDFNSRILNFFNSN